MDAGRIFVADRRQEPASGETYQPINRANEKPLTPVIPLTAGHAPCSIS